MSESKKRHFQMPTVKRIVEYWNNKFTIYDKECFACGRIAPLHRAHIVPSWIEENNHVSNLHLLCTMCHAESEGLKLYQEWFDYKRKNERKDPVSHVIDMWKKCGIPFDEDAKEFELYEEKFGIEKYYKELLPRYIEETLDKVYYNKPYAKKEMGM